MSPPESPSRWRAAPALSVALAMAPVAVLVLQKLPQGFAVGHERFWVNTALPIALLVLGPVALLGVVRARLAVPALAGAVVTTLPIGAWLTFEWLHPVSSAVLPGWLPLALACPALVLVPLRFARRAIAGGGALGLLMGAGATAAVRAPEPSTRPIAERIPPSEPEPGRVDLGPGGTFVENASALIITAADLTLQVEPLLTFESRSPDRSWTVLAPSEDHFMPRRLVRAGRMGGAAVALYSTDGPERLSVERGDDGWRLESFTELPRPVFAHLDSFTDLHFEADGRTSVSLSPCGDQVIDVHPSDYPEGRPVRFGALYPDGRFRVLEATTGEKGPFGEICAGPLGDDEALTLTFLVDGEPRSTVTWYDFASQASTDPSPTAGWGVPQNAVSLFRQGEDPNAPIFVRATLAATGVGRGWDSVGHRAGVYRNRMDVRIVSR